MLSFKTFVRLNEELTPEQKQTVSNWERDPKAIAHTDHFFGKNNDDKIENLKGGIDKSEPHRAVERHLGHEISHEDYKSGKTKDKYGREVKIGSMLKKTKADPKLINQFSNDNTRQLKKQQGLTVHVTRSAAGVAGQTSSGQSWENQSCKNFEGGSNREYLRHEVRHGTVVAYLKNHHGHELARQTFQPHHRGDGKVVYKRNSYYGPKHAEFEKHGEDLEKRLSASHKPSSKIYSIHPEVYNDSDYSKTLHPNATTKHIAHALKDKDFEVRETAILHPNATPEHITHALKDEDHYVRIAAVQHPKATPEHITHALKDENRDVVLAASKHATPEQILSAAKQRMKAASAATKK